MDLEKQLTEKLKMAMKEKNTLTLEALRAVKSAILLAKTKGSDTGLTQEQELQIVQKQVKQRKESAELFTSQNRQDLADSELAQAKIIAQFLPEQLTNQEIEAVVVAAINQMKASGVKDMGKVIGAVSKQLAGKAQGKAIADIVKKKLM